MNYQTKRDRSSAAFYLTGKQIIDALEESHAQDKMSDTLAAHFTLLINRIATHRHFSGYSYLDDMKARAMLNLVKHWRVLDIDAEKVNPFAYFTTAVRNSFIQEIKQQKHQADIKEALFIEVASDEQLLEHFENRHILHDSDK